MSNLLKSTFAILLLTSLNLFSARAGTKNVSIIVPLEHEAMIQIVSGIKESLKNTDANIEVKNAHFDPNLMLTIIKQIKDRDIDIIMPIGTTATQMTISHIKNRQIIAVATSFNDTNNPLLTSINDEVPVTNSISRLPVLKNIAVIYSASEKIIPEINELKTYATQNNVKLHLSMIQTLTDLPLAARNAPKDIQAFLILKDHLAVSGANIIALEANKRSIPFITSDEGSVLKGASMAIGVKEKDIGTEAGNMAKQLINGAVRVENKKIDNFTVFINSKAFAKQSVLTEDDIKSLNLPIAKIE